MPTSASYVLTDLINTDQHLFVFIDAEYHSLQLCQHDKVPEAPVHYRFGVGVFTCVIHVVGLRCFVAFGSIPEAADEALKAYDAAEQTSPVIKMEEQDEDRQIECLSRDMNVLFSFYCV